jgi:hypothetical protein
MSKKITKSHITYPLRMKQDLYQQVIDIQDACVDDTRTKAGILREALILGLAIIKERIQNEK